MTHPRFTRRPHYLSEKLAGPLELTLLDGESFTIHPEDIGAYDTLSVTGKGTIRTAYGVKLKELVAPDCDVHLGEEFSGFSIQAANLTSEDSVDLLHGLHCTGDVDIKGWLSLDDLAGPSAIDGNLTCGGMDVNADLEIGGDLEVRDAPKVNVKRLRLFGRNLGKTEIHEDEDCADELRDGRNLIIDTLNRIDDLALAVNPTMHYAGQTPAWFVNAAYYGSFGKVSEEWGPEQKGHGITVPMLILKDLIAVYGEMAGDVTLMENEDWYRNALHFSQNGAADQGIEIPDLIGEQDAPEAAAEDLRA